MSSSDSATSYELSKRFSVSPEALFDALTSAVVLKRIWGVQDIDVDARVGGRTHAVYIIDGQDWSFTITDTEVNRDSGRIRWVVRFTSFPLKETRVSVELTRVSNGTALKLRMENFETPEECNANRQAWEHGLMSLAEVVGETNGSSS